VTTVLTEVTVVVPVYNEVESLPELYEWCIKVLNKNELSYELIFIDDGSDDGSWQVIEGLSAKDQSVKGIRFTRNYGKSAALHKGFEAAKGKVVITMDADLQDSPDEIPELYQMVTEKGYHLVSGWKKKRKDPLEKRLPSKFFNYITRLVSGIKLHDFNCGLKAYQSQVIKNISVYGEMHRYIPLLAKWNGFKKIGEKVVAHNPRKYGHTKFGFERYIKGFLDLVSIVFVTRFNKNPMHFFGTLGTLSFLSGFFISIYVIGEKIYNIRQNLPVRDVVDQPLFFLSLVALIIGVQLFLAGFLAEIVILNNPKKDEYLVSSRLNLND
jgi:glycosyltransferase involved in cell wall biosynthesis